jgi:RNA polymerase sigma-70 factor (ECF subfamily)
MGESPVTRASLLIRLRDGQDKEAWRQFVQLYASLIYGFARKRGLQDADAADLMQEVLRSVASAAGRLEYDPQRGSFRNWLYTVTRNKLYTFLSQRKRQVSGSGDSGVQERLEEEPAPDSDADSLWEQEYQRRLFTWAADIVRGDFQPATWQAFWRTAVDGQDPREVAQQLGLSPGSVYVAKSRVLARIREQIQQVEDE